MIHWWQQMPPGEQGLSRQRLPADGAKLGYWLAGSRDRYLLALGNSIDHLAAMVPQFADRDFGHVCIVSRVIQTALAGSQGASVLKSPLPLLPAGALPMRRVALPAPHYEQDPQNGDHDHEEQSKITDEQSGPQREYRKRRTCA